MHIFLSTDKLDFCKAKQKKGALKPTKDIENTEFRYPLHSFWRWPELRNSTILRMTSRRYDYRFRLDLLLGNGLSHDSEVQKITNDRGKFVCKPKSKQIWSILSYALVDFKHFLFNNRFCLVKIL